MNKESLEWLINSSVYDHIDIQVDGEIIPFQDIITMLRKEMDILGGEDFFRQFME